MDNLQIVGGKCLQGEIKVSGSKNAALPILAASLLTEQPLLLRNIPHLRDVTTMLSLLGQMGVEFIVDEQMGIHINAKNVHSKTAPYNLVRTMRASILVLGPLLSRFGEANVSLPGGCAIGSRPVDLHIEGMRKLGATISVDDGYIRAKAEQGLKGCVIDLPMTTVTGTENLIMAAVFAEGVTVIKNAALEPEVTDLIDFLNSVGAKITGKETDEITIEGVEKLGGTDHYEVLSDRIEAGTYLIAAAATGGQIKLNNISPTILTAVLDKLTDAGAKIETGENWVALSMLNKPKPVDIITKPYPGLPTDMQAQFVALNLIADGESTITETVFENRFMHINEMQRMGANLIMNGNTVKCIGVAQLHAAEVMATDLRASAGLVIAALVADGKTKINRIYHIDRGYESLEEKLAKLGAHIKRGRG